MSRFVGDEEEAQMLADQIKAQIKAARENETAPPNHDGEPIERANASDESGDET